MPRATSATGLIAARVRPVRRPKPKKVELLGPVVPAPFTLRPFAGLFNPFPYGCSVLCNHPADGEVKEVVRRAKDTWTSEGKAMLLPAEVEMMRSGLRPGGSDHEHPSDGGLEVGAVVPEELFRRYTETDSRPPSPTSPEPSESASKEIEDVRERATLVLDLRASSHEMQENETLSWRALTLEPIPSSRRSDLTGSSMSSSRRKPPISSRHRCSTAVSSSPVRSVPILEVSDAASTRSAPTKLAREDDDDDEEEEEESATEESAPMRRRGKLRRKKRKCRRGSIYGQQTEVREPPEPLETQVSQIDEGSRRGSTCTRLEETKQASFDKVTLPTIKQDMPPSFLPPEMLKELSRGLDQDMVEWEFNAKRRYALEEALRVTGDHAGFRAPRQSPVQSTPQNVPRLFYRQSARFELLDSLSLVGLSPLSYLARHVHVTESRKALFGRAFTRHREEVAAGAPRRLPQHNLADALHEVMGRPLTEAELEQLESTLGLRPTDRLDFRTWCGVCAFAERTLPELPKRELDPPPWLERADFEVLERRLAGVSVDAKLAEMLRIIRDR